MARRGVALAGAALVAVAAFVWWPNGEYRPIQPGERGRIQDTVRAARSLPTGRPSLTPERAEELEGAPFRSRAAAQEIDGPGLEDPVPTTTTTTATTSTTAAADQPGATSGSDPANEPTPTRAPTTTRSPAVTTTSVSPSSTTTTSTTTSTTSTTTPDPVAPTTNPEPLLP